MLAGMPATAIQSLPGTGANPRTRRTPSRPISSCAPLFSRSIWRVARRPLWFVPTNRSGSRECASTMPSAEMSWRATLDGMPSTFGAAGKV